MSATNNENTPLLHGDHSSSPQDVEAQQHSVLSKQFWGIQAFTSLSLILCLTTFLFGGIITILYESGRYSYYLLPYQLHGYLGFGGQLAFWVALASVLNFARHRRDGTQLPWSLNLVIDFVGSLSAIFVAVLYFVVNATYVETCYDGRGRSYPCPPKTNIMRTLGTLEMITVLFLGLTHFVLLVLRVRNPPQDSTSGRGNGWFCGLGRGPLGVAVRSFPSREGSGS